MNNKGFAITGIIYSILLLFVALLIGILAMLVSRKVILDDAKNETLTKLNNTEIIGSQYTEDNYVKRDLLLWYDSIINKKMIENGEISNNIFKDLSGNNNDGSLLNFDHNSDSGWNNNHLKFDGNNDTVDTGLDAASTFSSDSNFTIETYIKINKITANGNNNGQSDTGAIVGAFDYNGYGISWRTNNQRTDEYTLVAGNRVSSDEKAILKKYNDFENKIHIVQIYDNSAQKQFMYINGQRVGENKTVEGNFNYASNTGNIGINKNQIYGGNFQASFIDMNVYNLKIYNRALSENEVIKNYNIDRIRY